MPKGKRLQIEELFWRILVSTSRSTGSRSRTFVLVAGLVDDRRSLSKKSIIRLPDVT